MSITAFIREKIISILVVASALFVSTILLVLSKTNTAIIILVMSTLLLSFGGCLVLEYCRKYSFYKNLTKCIETLKKAYLLSEVIEYPNFLEGRILYETLKTSNKAMNDQIAIYKLATEEYREYIEAWVHEVKTPIASSLLIIENNPSKISTSLGEEMTKIDGFVEQALFYSRSNTIEKDYIIKEYQLHDLVASCIRRNAKELIQDRIEVDIEQCIHHVFTDGKWIDFILNQLASNSIKYRKPQALIRYYSRENKNSISLFIEDNGIGITEQDLPRVFDKGFTGDNGRKYAKATGLGLYLCKKLCIKLGLGIFITSNNGTTVEIVFPIGKLTTL